jgi:hypothetical protein
LDSVLALPDRRFVIFRDSPSSPSSDRVVADTTLAAQRELLFEAQAFGSGAYVLRVDKHFEQRGMGELVAEFVAHNGMQVNGRSKTGFSPCVHFSIGVGDFRALQIWLLCPVLKPAGWTRHPWDIW